MTDTSRRTAEARAASGATSGTSSAPTRARCSGLIVLGAAGALLRSDRAAGLARRTELSVDPRRDMTVAEPSRPAWRIRWAPTSWAATCWRG